MLNKNTTNKDHLKTKSKLWFSYFEAGLTSLVVGFAETYFSAFALEQKLSPISSGLLLSLPLVFAVLFQFGFQSRLKNVNLSFFVKRSVFIQALALLGLASVSLLPMPMTTAFTFYVLLFLFSIYWLGHYCTQPAWNRWITDIVKLEHAEHYFSIRTRITQIGILIGLFIGGAALQLNILNVSLKFLFFQLFFLSFILKLGVIYLFKKHPLQKQTLNLNSDWLKKLFWQNKLFFNRYFLFNTSVYLSAPFVAGYLLSVRQLSYLQFMIVMSGLFLGKVLTTYTLQHLKNKPSAYQLFFIGGLMAAPLPILWPLCRGVLSLFSLHFISGIGWAGWEMGIALYFFKHIDEKAKVEMISLYNYVGIASQVLGTVLGAVIFKNLVHESLDSLFIFAGCVRSLAILGLRKPKMTSVLE